MWPDDDSEWAHQQELEQEEYEQRRAAMSAETREEESDESVPSH